MAGVFINYRNQDEPFAAALIDRALVSRFGERHVFRASRSVEAGDFQPQILDRLRGASVVVAVIGERWVGVEDNTSRRRLEDPQDWVRREIVLAFQWHIPVIPVLVNSQMPTAEELPEDLTELVVQHYTRMHHRTVENDVDRLARMIERVVPELGFHDLVERTWRPPRTNRPSVLLDPREEIVRFRDRGGHIAVLRDWCRDSDAPTVMLVTGAAGVGKTRLAAELCKQMQAKHWLAGFIPRNLTVTTLNRIQSARGKALLVIDQAETRPEQVVAALTAALSRASEMPRVAILLLARTTGDWFDEIQDAGWGGLLAPSVARWGLAPGDGSSEYDWARRSFAKVLGASEPATVLPRAFASPMDAHEAALADVLGSYDGSGDLLARERQYWDQTRDLYELSDPHRSRCDQVVATACLYGSDTDAEALRTLARLPTFQSSETGVIQRYADWARDLYPGENALNATGSIRLTEYHVITTVRKTPALLNLLPEVTDRQASRALALIAGVLNGHPDLNAPLVDSLRRTPSRLLPLCIGVVATLPAPEALIIAMTESLAGLTEDELTAVVSKLPQRSLALGAFALTSEELAWKRMPRGDIDAARLGLRFAARAAYMGERLEEALAAAVAAIDSIPKNETAELAESYAVIALVHDEAGRPAEAVEASLRALELFREANVNKPGALATALHNQSVRLRKAKRVPEAADLASEAVGLATALAAENRAAYLSLLADALDNFSAVTGQQGDIVEAVILAERAVTLRRELAARRPDSYIPELAATLNTLGTILRLSGDREGAHEALNEAIDLLIPLMKLHPGRFDSAMAKIRRNIAAVTGQNNA